MARKQDDDEILREAKARFTRCQDWEAVARERALEDARFANADERNGWQWPAAIAKDRGDRPSLTYNKTRQHNLHIINDARQHKAAIKVTPVGAHATFEAAEVYSAIVRRIEYQSKAVDAYSTANYHQVESGIGYVRVVTDWADEDSFDQDIFIRRVADPRTVFMDPDAQDYDKGDARFAFVFTDTPRTEFEAKYPKAEAWGGAALDYDDTWDTKDHVREAEYWRRGEKTEKLLLLSSGQTVRASELPPGARAVIQVVKERDVAEPEIEWFKLAGNEITERKTWLGKYIPIVPCIGEETVIDGQMDRKGHTRCLLSPQRMFNYMASSAAEQVALQTKSPYLADPRALEGYETYWNTANTVNHPYLPYNSQDPDTGQAIEKPERINPPAMAEGYMRAIQQARQDMMEVSGQYQAEMGAPGNEKSGVAIQQRQREGETATYHYIDNQAKMIRQVGRIVVDLIPKIYDTARVIKIMAEDGTQSDVHVDPNAPDAHQHVMPSQGPGQPPQPISPEQADQAHEDDTVPDPSIIFNPTIGRYDVEADVGPSWGTQREEAANALQQIIQSAPDLVHVAGDLLAANMDWPGADALAERLKRGVPPQYLGGPSPQVTQMQQQMQGMQQTAQQHLGAADKEIADLKQQLTVLQGQMKDRADDVKTRDYAAETARLQAVTAADPGSAQVLVRSMLSGLLGMPALPVIQAHAQADAEHAQMIAPPEPAAAGDAAPTVQ